MSARSAPHRVASRHHHGSHRRLLATPAHAPHLGSLVDAIIVPTIRPSVYLETALSVARDLGCVLVALCSRKASTYETERRAWAAGVELVAINTERLPVGLLPDFATSELVSKTVFEIRQDLSLKRNLGLLLARAAGWERIVFLDDDIAVPNPDDLSEAASLLNQYAGVGLRNEWYPDNSVVCHAFREVGGQQDTFVGGGALAVGAASVTSFFPNIYNEDWFFLLDDVQMRPTAMTGRVLQAAYDPFASEHRARAEEFGDTLAEGVYWLLDHGRRVQDASIGFWQEYLCKRRKFIDDVIDMVARSGKELVTKHRMNVALKAALSRSDLITPELCVDYLRAWRTDRTRWRRHLDAILRPGRLPIPKVLAELGLMSCSRYITTNEREPIPTWGRGAGSRRVS